MNLSIFEDGQKDQNVQIFDLENEILDLPQLSLEPVHYFAKGLYARELFIPKGTILTGKIHLKEHLCIVPYGDISVANDGETKRIQGYATFVGTPGGKRAGYAHEDTLWIAIHATENVTVEECEEELVTNDYDRFLQVLEEQKKCLL